MDRDVAQSSSARAQPPSPTTAKNDGLGSPKKTPSSSITGSRHSPVTPLAPLEYLQNQRRGSITDPSLHAGPIPPSHPATALNNLSSPFRHPEANPSATPSTSHEAPQHSPRAQPRPASPYKFGDASGDTSNAHLRRLLRSPSTDAERRNSIEGGRGSEKGPNGSVASAEPSSSGGAWFCSILHVGDCLYSLRRQSTEANRAKGSDAMDIDPREGDRRPRYEASGSQRAPSTRETGEVDYSTRRPSIAGTKRKMSSDRGVHTPGTEDIDPQLVGSGGTGSMSVDDEGPAPKRRGSAVDARIANLSLYDRRNSVDARLGGQWWGAERRESTMSSSTPMGSTPVGSTPGNTPLSNTPLTGGYTTPSSAFPGESPHGRPPGGIATFAWPAHPDQAPGPPPPMQNEPNVNMSAHPPYDPLSVMPQMSFPPDRRMSAPAVPADNLPPAATGPTRVLRSRSRPPSRARGGDQSAANAGPSSALSPGNAQPDVSAAASQHSASGKEQGSTPYSRSPELRVSHKLAERKRRKEMKDLFDELRDQLPADRGMKASKWEILSKAIDFIGNLKQSHQELTREVEILRHELESMRQGIPPPFGAPPHPVVYGHGPPVGVPPYPPPGVPGGPMPPHQGPPPPHAQHPQHQPHPHPPPHHQQHPPPQPLSRPGSSQQNAYPPDPQALPPQQTANGNGQVAPRTETPS
ncbi:hypothetical protein OBBRIDRAFT_789607 [Obba rivulosa]|uniref:BHLH domain-containing protein n=1 Tax=Obba rivulosa TaxID=1052685 RepID=A0A8E2DQQ7_9APHY|nr:hypothetical protein OBBRIDRAFT_789607 [Obba rivulosa]